jgi:cytochrome c biogenesis protein
MSVDEAVPTESGHPPGGRDDRPEVLQPRLGPIGWLRWTWRQLTSMRTALMLLLLLAIAAIPGSIIPQTSIDPARVDAYRADHPTLGPWVERLDGFHVYSSPWFSAIYLLLFVSLVGCVLPRSRQHWKAVRAVPPRAPRRLDRMAAHRRETLDARPDAVLETAAVALRGRRYRVTRHDDSSVSAERGYLGETGNLAFHLSLLGLLASVAAGSFLAYNGQALVIVGRTWSNTSAQYDSFSAGRAVDVDELPPYSFTLDDLKVRFDGSSAGNQFGAARDFTATVSYRARPGAPVRKRIVKVNRPLDVDGARVFLIGNGYAPVITVRDGHGDVAWSGPVPFVATDSKYTSNGVVKVPDALPKQIGLVGFLLPTAATNRLGQPISIFPDLGNPRLVFTAYTGDLGADDGVPRSVYTIDLKKLTQVTQGGRPFSAALAPGQSAALPGELGTVTFDGVRRYAALNVRSDPTKIWVLAFAVIALTGLTLSLFVRRRRVWVRAVTDDDGRTVVEVAGLARQENVDLTVETGAVMAAVTQSVTRREPNQ